MCCNRPWGSTADTAHPDSDGKGQHVCGTGLIQAGSHLGKAGLSEFSDDASENWAADPASLDPGFRSPRLGKEGLPALSDLASARLGKVGRSEVSEEACEPFGNWSEDGSGSVAPLFFKSCTSRLGKVGLPPTSDLESAGLGKAGTAMSTSDRVSARLGKAGKVM